MWKTIILSYIYVKKDGALGILTNIVEDQKKKIVEKSPYVIKKV